MADVMRWRFGETNPVVAPADAAEGIEIGDLVLFDGGTAKPASSVNDIGGAGPANLAAAQEVFHDQFLGVAMQRSAVGEGREIRVATSGVFELACTAATFELGDRVGADVDGGGTALASQAAAGTSEGAPERSIGRAARRTGGPANSVLVDLRSTVMRDGPQAAA